jgi:curved DNA-binding protein CbpA
LSEAQKRTPRPVANRGDAKRFPLSPTDGFVLSRIDGNLSEADLASSTGIPEDSVRASLTKLEALGLIVFDKTADDDAHEFPGPRSSFVQMRAAPFAPTVPVLTRPPVPMRTPVPTASAGAATRVFGTPPVPPRAPPEPARAPPEPPRAPPEPPRSGPSIEEAAALVEDVDLEPEVRKRVVDAFRDLELRDHYAMLGVEEAADKKAIKRAYYELAATFHPDRYFRKRLGSFKVRMEAVFARLTIAHDILSDRAKRKEYDVYLSEQRISRAIEENLARGVSQAQQTEERLERTVRAEVGVEPAASGSAAAAGSAVPAPPSSSAQVAPPSSPQIDVAARREALARRLLGGNSTRPSMGRVNPDSSGSFAAAPPAPASMSPADAVNALRRRYEERMERAKQSEARKFAGQAEAALTAGDLVAAANAFRIAANLTKNDVELEKRALEARMKADAMLSETYTRQAHYEETHDQWIEAARSWARVCKASPDDANAHERAAHALVKTKGDLHDAARLGQRACELEPQNPYFRVTLASCYSAAGLVLNARRELDTAAQLAPHDGTIQSMIRRVGQPA